MLIERIAPALVALSGSEGTGLSLAAYHGMHRSPRSAGNGLASQSQRLCREFTHISVDDEL